jgi:hypothetical protein
MVAKVQNADFRFYGSRLSQSYHREGTYLRKAAVHQIELKVR